MTDKELKILKIFTGLCTLGSALFSYMSFNMPIEVKESFNVSDGFWIAWGYIFIACTIVWGIGFISSLCSPKEKGCKKYYIREDGFEVCCGHTGEMINSEMIIQFCDECSENSPNGKEGGK